MGVSQKAIFAVKDIFQKFCGKRPKSCLFTPVFRLYGRTGSGTFFSR
jgi:hypothetical protein